MRKLLVIFLLAVPWLFTASPMSAQTAQSDQAIGMPQRILPPQNQFPNILGQDHRYTVTLRGNGEAVVFFKVAFSNTADKPLNEFSLRVPKVNPQDIAVFQVLREPQCLRYKQPPIEIQGQSGTSQSLIYPRPPPVCEEYQEPDYFGYWYGEAKYQKATAELRGDTIVITLPKPVKANASGSYIVYFRAFGYVKKNLFGSFNFAFETLKVNDKIQTVQVGITTDSDLILAGTKTKVNYRFDESVASLKSMGTAAEAVRSPQLDQFTQQIGYGEITKTASNLMPLETYSVKGAYADSYLRLYAKWFLAGIVGLILFIFVAVISIKALIKALGRKPATEKVQIPAFKTNPTVDIVAILGLSFLSSVILAIVTFGIIMFSRLVFPSLPSEATVFLAILTIIVTALLYMLLLLGPALFLGMKRGLWWGIAAFAATAGWLILYVLILFIVLLAQSGSSTPPYPLPFLDQMRGGAAVQSEPSQPSGGSTIK